MEFTSQQNLPCLDDDDVSAIALYMKCLADQVDATLTRQFDELTAFLAAPAAAWIATAAQSISTAVNTSGTTLTFASPAAWSANWPGGPPASPSLPNLRGWYYISCNVNLLAAAPTLNSTRTMTLKAVSLTDVGPNVTLGTFVDKVYESNTGNGENLLAAGTVYFPGVNTAAVNPTTLSAVVLPSGQAGALNTTLTPPATMWAFYLGDTPQIEVP